MTVTKQAGRTPAKLAPLAEPPPSKSAALRVWTENDLDNAVAMLHEHEHVSDTRSYSKANQARAAARTLQRALLRDRDVRTSTRVWFSVETRRWRWALKLKDTKEQTK
jgi:hypothetical protein